MGSTDKSFSNTGYEPKDYFLTETYVEFNQESVTEQRFPEQRFTEDMDYDDAAIGQMLFNAYRRQVDHSEREGLSSGLSSSSMSQDRTGQPAVNSDKSHDGTGQPIAEGHEQIGLFWTGKESKSSLTARRRTENANSKLIMTEEVYKN